MNTMKWGLCWLTFTACSVAYPADERWEVLVPGRTGGVDYDKKTFQSTRESAGGWIRTRVDGDRRLDFLLVGVQCGTHLGDFVVYKAQIIAADGRPSEIDEAGKSWTIVPGSDYENVRNALCRKRPKWQQILSK